MRCKTGMHVQTIIFPKDRWSVKSARAWLRAHGYKAGKVDEKEETFRFRQLSPKLEHDYKTIEFGHSGIKAIVGCPY